jgi:hypothetical protein
MALLSLCALVLSGIASGSCSANITVYALDFDFSTVNNPNGVWSYYNGNTLLASFSPLPGPLPAGMANSYWGQSSGNANGAMLRAIADGSTVPPFSDWDFENFDVLVRTPDPGMGGPARIVFTAPTAGQLTYGASLVWNANGPLGPVINDFLLTINNGPILESGSINMLNDRANPVVFVNGFNLYSVQAGDQLILEFQPNGGSPSGGLLGVGFTIDFTPVPEPSSGCLAILIGLVGSSMARHRKTASCN